MHVAGYPFVALYVYQKIFFMKVSGPLVDFGCEEIDSLITGRKKKRFFVEIMMDNSELKRLYGLDLERALHEAGADLGDRVEVDFQGFIRISIPGVDDEDSGRIVRKSRRVFKRSFAITLLESAENMR